jgi:hypothetical protein
MSPPLAPPWDWLALPATPAPMLERTLPPALSVPALALEPEPAALCEASLAITLDREIRGLRPGRTFAFSGAGGFAGEEDFCSAAWPTMVVAAVVNDMGACAGGELRG